jgi:glycosylphosphatidylinositol transamidase (GPIT) subunit GPI8
MLEKHGVKMFSTNSDKKAQVVERFNRTLKLRMGKLFDAQNSFRYVDKLQDLVNNYNNTVHSTIKMKPVDAIKPENYDKLMTNYYANFPNSALKVKV